MDKAMSKRLMRSCHIPVADEVFIRRSDKISDFDERLKRLGFPLVVKPNRGGGSVGVAIANSDEALYKAAAFVINDLDDDVLIEQFLPGFEVSCGILETTSGVSLLPVLDIEAAGEFYDYNAKYFSIDTRIEFSRLPDFQQAMIHEISRKVFEALGGQGYGVVDMIVCEEQVYVLEMNTLPGLTKSSLMPKAALGAGYSLSDLLDSLIKFGLKKI
jgi:D-alanine-D-alanine ligase